MLLSYARVSTARQGDDEKHSIPDQLRKNGAVAQMRNISKFDIVEYVDKGVSGGMPFTKRPEGGKLWLEMKPGDVVVAAKLDRMFRSASDALVMLERFREQKVGVILLDLSVDPIGETPVSEAFFGMLAIFANLERRMINERTEMGKKNKRAKGGYLGGKAPPYGFKVEGEGKSAILVPVEDEQHVINIVRYHRQRDKSYGEIIGELTARNIVARSGKPFERYHIHRILSQERGLQ